ncbi:phthiocerol/phthiodiolone dimycocerosyl transferase family protein [Mycolicibacterium psychrotolerans]|uniref:Phthiocerol/phthiodiolone dimycocerosyl transferase n=1 Tax=Mycolicibacterium psychrotolerans TaxID=216929 RepID=A0A7I7MD02_9MYCO|nr:acyltransferase [Mycolicibacterium psychrotolerans]BBX70191.1 phthiocerol/phthiodiolone dimycocerosyl transferase [Mycolicibacterium psychrotolerans]
MNVFPSSVIRKLARSEEMYAESHNFIGLGATARGSVDIEAMSVAFDTMLQAHPVLGGHLEKDADGRFAIVVDDLLHPGIEVIELDDADEPPPVFFDQSQALTYCRVLLRGDEAQIVLYIHHSLADGQHQFSLIEKMLANYTDLVTTGEMRPMSIQPAPDSLESVLADRGVEKKDRSGLERLMAAMFTYDLPPSRRAASDVTPPYPMRVPMVYCKLSASETERLIAFSRSQKLGLNGLLSAAILCAEWQLRKTPKIPVPYVYPVDLRYVLSPPVSATACTNPVGVATYLAEITDDTDPIDLARDIVETFRKDLSDGIIQQSMLHFSPQYVGNPPGMPDVVMFTDNGVIPPMRTPPDLELTASHGELYFQVSAGIEIYTSKIFNGQLMIEYHSHGAEPEKSIAAIEGLLKRFAAMALA